MLISHPSVCLGGILFRDRGQGGCGKVKKRLDLKLALGVKIKTEYGCCLRCSGGKERRCKYEVKSIFYKRDHT